MTWRKAHEALHLIHGAVRLSSNAIGRDSTQFASQMVGRLLPHQGLPTIKQFIAELVRGAPKPCLRLLQSTLHPPGTSLVRTLEGHSSYVHGVAVSADGRRAASASDDHTLKLWDLGAEEPFATFTCDTAVLSCAFFGDDKLIAGDAGGRVHFLSLEEPKPEN